MTEYDEDFLQKLKQLCLEFDSKASWWLDPDLVGFAIYQFAKNPPPEPIYVNVLEELNKCIEYTVEGKAYIKELEKLQDGE